MTSDMSETGHTPLIIAQSDDGRVVTIDGYKFATDLLRQFTASPLGERFRIVSREAGVITVSVERDALEYAAPDMLAALVNVEAVLSIVPPRSDMAEYLAALSQVRAAIAKAKATGAQT